VTAGERPGWWLIGLARPAWARFGLGILAGAGALGSAVGLAALAAWLVSRAAEYPPVLYLSMAIVGVRAFGIGRGVLRYAERVITHDVAFRILADLRVRIVEALERLAPAGLPAFRRGDLLGRLVADVDDAQDLFLRVLVPPVIAVVVGGGAVAISTALLPAAGLILLAGLAVAGIVAPWLAAVTSRHGERRVAALRGELNASTVELLDGAAELVAYGAADERLAALDRLDTRLTGLAARSARTSGVGSAITHLATGASVLGALLVGIPAVRSGALDRVNLAVIALLPLAAFEAVATLPMAAQYGQRLRRSAGRVYEVLSTPAPVAEPAAPVALPVGPYALVTNRLTARWPGADRAAVQELDLVLTPGRRVAVVGASGAGKSTVAAALLRFVESSGATLNGIPLERLDPDDVRRVVGLCAQDAHLFDSTIRENLLLARRSASPAELGLALRRSRLEGWIEGLPDGLDTQVGEHGAKVSGGQRQRIALARALLADFPILLLDEPAANLDVDTADALTADLLDATRGRTVLLITHRLAGLESVDEIVVLDGGRVIERGTHADLLARPTRYRRWWEREQMSGLFVHV
jgi:thiol reductant ABC exporter CydC subunit